MKSFLQFKTFQICTLLFFGLFLANTNSSALCTASFISVPDSTGNGVTFINTSTGTTGTTQYFWSFGDNTSGSNMNEYHTYNSTGWYNVCLLIMDTNCQSTSCDSVFVGNIVNFCQASFNSQVNGLTASFTEQCVGANLNYSWDFGDGASASGQNATHSYALPGQYLVCLTIWNSTCSDTTCSYVTIGNGNNCLASFTTQDSAGVTYFFGSSVGTGFPSYSWDFGDGNFGTGQYPVHAYNSMGWFYPCLTVTFTDTNQAVLCTATTCDSISNYTGICQALWNSSPGTAAGEIDFTDLSTGSDSITGWYWNFGDGNASTQQNPSHVYTLSGPYYVCLTITTSDLNGTTTCTNTYCSWVQVQNGNGCQASFQYYDSLGYIAFMSTSTGISWVTTQFFWDFGDNTSSTLPMPSHLFNGPGPYYVCLTITDTMTGCFDTFCDSVYIGSCQASFNIVPDTTGFGFSFYNTSTGTNSTTTYLWTSSDGSTGTGPVFQHTFTTQGWFQVCLTINVYDSLQFLICTSTTCDSIYTGNGGGAQCNADWGYQTSNFAAYFADLSTGTDTISSWLWNFGDGNTSTQQNPVHTYLQSGYYLVCLTIETSALGVITCTDTYCQTIYAGLNSNGCQANFSIYPDTSGYGFQFQNISTGTTGSTNYYWTFGDGGTSTQENPFHAYMTTGWYSVCLTISDSIGNCTSTICDSLNVGGNMFCSPYFVWSSDTTNGVQFNQFNNNLPGMYFEWDFGDGDSSALADPYHQYAAAGVYYACLTVYQLDTNGWVLCSGTWCDSVYAGMNPNCAPQINASPDSNSWGNGNVNFNIYSACGNIGNVTWNFGDGSTGTGMNTSHTYLGTGWYWVCVDVEIDGIIYTTCDSVFALRLVGIQETAGISIAELYPNPANNYIHISYTLSKQSQVSMSLYDLAGRKVKLISDEGKVSGLHKEMIDLRDVSMGMYLLQITVEGSTASMRIVINR